MYVSLLAAGFLAAQAPAADRANDRNSTQSLDGNWTVVCLEKDGQPQADAKNMTVTVKDNTITCTGKDGKPAMTWKVQFGPQATVTVMDQSQQSGGAAGADANRDQQKALSGVYVKAQDFIAICLHDDAQQKQQGGQQGQQNNQGGNATGNASGTGGSQQFSKTKCTIILKREGSGSGGGSNPDRR